MLPYIGAQETFLGTYTDQRGCEKLAAACKDFTEGGKRLIEFAQLKNTCINSSQNGHGTELCSILQAIEEQTLIPAGQLKAHFWDMFIVDALLGNFDRTSAIMDGGAKISYPRLTASLQNEGCNQAMERISARIDMARIETLIQQTPGLLPIQREFYGIMLQARKEQILDCGMERLLRVRAQQLDGPVLNM